MSVCVCAAVCVCVCALYDCISDNTQSREGPGGNEILMGSLLAAWLGLCPGHGSQNRPKSLMRSQNKARSPVTTGTCAATWTEASGGFSAGRANSHPTAGASSPPGAQVIMKHHFTDRRGEQSPTTSPPSAWPARSPRRRAYKHTDRSYKGSWVCRWCVLERTGSWREGEAAVTSVLSPQSCVWAIKRAVGSLGRCCEHTR